MKNTEKESWFEEVSATQNYQVQIIPLLNSQGHQGIQLTLPCGCSQMEVYISAEDNTRSLNQILEDDNRQQSFLFCLDHINHPNGKTLSNSPYN